MMQECLICLDKMNKADIAYPILCNCGYNFCINCIEHMIETSKQPMEMASDGNVAVKIQLQCPQCRFDLRDTLHDTLILRKVETFKRLLEENDSELTASELRQKHSLKHEKLSSVLQDAQDKYSKFNLIRKTSSDSEEGVEVMGPLDSQSLLGTSRHRSYEKPPPIDTSLFPGLHFFMSEEEQTFVFELMTSGNVAKLAQAAQILHGVAQMSRKGKIPKSTINNNFRSPGDIENLVNNSAQRRYSRRSSHTHNTSTLSREGSVRLSRNNATAVGRALAMGRTEEDRKEKARLERIEKIKRSTPLPSRMPNFIVLSSEIVRNIPPSHRSFPIHFVDDEWDGTIADAFARVCVSRKSIVTKLQSDNTQGITNLLCAGTGYDDDDDEDNSVVSMISEPARRVVITKIKGEAGKQGAQSGDVVTHLNGEIFTGSAEDLRRAIIEFGKRTDAGDLTFVLNAESSTAEALRLRAVVLSTCS